MSDYASVQDIINLKGVLTAEQVERAEAIIPVVCARLRYMADIVGRDLDAMIAEREDLSVIAKSVVSDVVMRELSSQASNNMAALSQYSESALGYSVSGTLANPAGGIFIKNAELKALGLTRQRYGTIEMWTPPEE